MKSRNTNGRTTTLHKVLSPVSQPGTATDKIVTPDASLEKGNLFIGDETINTRNTKVSASILTPD